MSARRVHAVLAAGVSRPDLILSWKNDPGFLCRHGIEPGSLDLSALWKFAGLTVKVRHNGVRCWLPMSFRLMAVAGLEIDLFASYASSFSASGQSLPQTTLERACKFMSFLEGWLDVKVREHAMLWDLVRHEHALATLSDVPALFPQGRFCNRLALPKAPSASSVPEVQGRIVLNEMSCDPRTVVLALSQRFPQLGDIDMAMRYLGYWRQEDSSEMRILELDEFSFYTLSCVDGSRSAAELNQLLGGRKHLEPKFLRLLGMLADLGILGFHPNLDEQLQ